MASEETFEIPLETAEAYERRFVPALFAEWAPLLLDAAGVQAGHGTVEVLDVACGTGIVARTAADRLGADGRVLGLDVNDAMLTVARRVRPDLGWRHGDVGALPLPDASFDAVVCQMAMMFFPDRAAALAEMGRVCRPDGVVGVVVPARLDDQPAYREFVAVAGRHAGAEAMTLLGTYWSCGEVDDLRSWCAAAGLDVLDVRTHVGTARFASPDDLVAIEVNASPLAERMDAEVYERIRADTAQALAPFVTVEGRFEPPLVGHVLTARPLPR